MAAPTGYPSWVYNQTQATSQIVANVAAFNALPPPGIWTTTPFATGSAVPADPGFIITDTRLQQMLVELRVSNEYLYQVAGVDTDDPAVVRNDVLLSDSSITS